MSNRIRFSRHSAVSALTDLITHILAKTEHKTELDCRREYAPKHNPGFDVKVRERTAKLCGVRL